MRFLIAFLLFVPSLMFSQELETDHRVFVPSTRISVIPPIGFELSGAFKGFINKNTSSTLAFAETDSTSYHMIKNSFTDEYFISQQLTVLSKEEVTLGIHQGQLFHLSFEVKGVSIERYMLVSGNNNYFLVAMCNYPTVAKSVSESILKDSLLSVRF